MLIPTLVFIALFVTLVCGVVLYQAYQLDRMRREVNALANRVKELETSTRELWEFYGHLRSMPKVDDLNVTNNKSYDHDLSNMR